MARRKPGRIAAEAVGALCALACGITAVVMAWQVSNGAGVALFSGLVMLCAIVGFPIGAALMGADEPFCEYHNRFMDRRTVRKISRHDSGEAMAAMKRGEFSRLASLGETKSDTNFAEVVLHFCPVCHEGYLSMSMTLSETSRNADGAKTTESETRLVFSETLEPAHVRAVLPAAARTV